MMAEPVSEHEANARMTRWISVSAAAAIMAIFAAAGFGCKTSYEAWQAVHHDCVSAGGNFLPLSDGKSMCLRGQVRP
jgi:hypothetical protein